MATQAIIVVTIGLVLIAALIVGAIVFFRWETRTDDPNIH